MQMLAVNERAMLFKLKIHKNSIKEVIKYESEKERN